MANISISYGSFIFSSKIGYPTPKVTFDLNKIRTSAGDLLTNEKIVTLEGICYAARKTDLNNPKSENELSSTEKDYSLSGLFKLAENLKSGLLTNNNSILKIKCDSSNNCLIEDRAKIDSITFSNNDNNWANTIDYNITFNIPMSGSGSYLVDQTLGFYISSATDNYSLESDFSNQFWDRTSNRPIPTYRVSRTIGAVGNFIHSPTGALYYAKKWVVERDKKSPLTGMFPESIFILYNQDRSIDVSEVNGSYTITDSFIAKSGDPWLDNFNISVDIDKNYIVSCSIEGSIQGLEPASGVYNNSFINIETSSDEAPVPRFPSGQKDIKPTISGYDNYTNNNGMKTNNSNISQIKYRNAISGWKVIEPLLYDRVSGYGSGSMIIVPSGMRGSSILNPIPLSIAENFYPFEGKMTYNRSYNTRPSTLITGALIESLSIQDQLPVLRYEETKVIGRRLGPVVYGYTDSYSIGSRTVDYQGVFPIPTGMSHYSFPKNIYRNITGIIIQNYAPNPIDLGVLTIINRQNATFFIYIAEDSFKLNPYSNTVNYTVKWEYTACN